MQVTVRNDNIGKALSIFKKKCGEIIMEVRERQYYEKPTTRRNRKRKMAIIRERKRQAKA
jgi:small subunit ribosomal protein S21